MKKIVIAVWLLALSMVACGGNASLFSYHSVAPDETFQDKKITPIYVDKNFSKENKKVIYDVINEWNVVLNGYNRIEVATWNFDKTDKAEAKKLRKSIRETNEGIILYSLKHDDPMLEDYIEDGDGVLAFVDALGRRAHNLVVIEDRIGKKNLHKIMLHEFGHAFGSMHVSSESLMFPYYSYLQLDCVDKITASQVATYNHYDLSKMNYCVTKNFE